MRSPAQKKVIRARLTWRQRIEASVRREARLRVWLATLERRAGLEREAKEPLPEALVKKLPFVRERLRRAVRNTAWLREQARKVR